MNTTKRIILAILVLGCAAGAAWWYVRQPTPSDELTLYGNVDFRQVTLAFKDSGRIADVLVEEGDHVHKGQPVAHLETSRLEYQIDQARAERQAQAAKLDELHNGTRPEEIAQARADLAAARAKAVDAGKTYQRRRALVKTSAVSREAADQARANADVADANVVVAQRALDLAIAGPRIEDIEQAQASLRAADAALNVLRQQRDDATLVSPVDAIVRSRLLEAGEMASPSSPVYSLAATNPKWVRAYVSETQLGHVHLGMKTEVTTDSSAGKVLNGWVGFISSVAEFTPKTVETEDLRTSLVYEVRIFVTDPEDVLRLGMPATVHLLPDDGSASTGPATNGPAIGAGSASGS